MSLPLWLIIVLSVVEVLLIVVVVFFFSRLRESESVLAQLQEKQEELLTKLRFNAQLEQELVATFEARQNELAELDATIETRVKELNALIRQAEEYSHSPQFMREVILSGHRQGKSPRELSRASGLSVDEVELIIAQEG